MWSKAILIIDLSGHSLEGQNTKSSSHANWQDQLACAWYQFEVALAIAEHGAL
jgi:hypothetical protein